MMYQNRIKFANESLLHFDTFENNQLLIIRRMFQQLKAFLLIYFFDSLPQAQCSLGGHVLGVKKRITQI